MAFTTDSIPNLSGKTALVTGANSGLGFETAKALAAKGAHVIVAARNADKAKAALDEIRAEQPLASLEVVSLDLSSLTSVRRCADDVQYRHKRLDILINNAGIMAPPYTRTEDGFELQFGTNHLGHFALTGQLFKLLTSTPGARVVTVSSVMHLLGKLRFDDLSWSQGYSKWPAYSMSKLANLLFSYELALRCQQAGLSLLSAAAHPGYAATNLQQRGAELAGQKLRAKLVRIFNPVGGQSPAMGALPQLYAATAPDMQAGDYVGPAHLFATRGHPKKMRSSQRSHDAAAMRELWEVSLKLTGVHYEGLSKRALGRASEDK